jgi:glycosyltransferase involved in cell wall biosynthesis
MSQQVKDDLKLFSAQPATLVPHPLYDNFGEKIEQGEARQWLQQHYHFALQPHDKVMLFFGLIRPYKGLDLLLEAMQQTKQPGVKLLIAGENYDDPAKYEALLHHPLLKDRVWPHFKFVANDEVKYFVGAADVVVQPYRHATQSGVTPVAYHFDIPMIVTEVGGLPEMVPHLVAGLVCQPNSAAIAEAIDTYFEKGKSWFLPGLGAEKKKLSWQVLVQQITNIPTPK